MHIRLSAIVFASLAVALAVAATLTAAELTRTVSVVSVSATNDSSPAEITYAAPAPSESDGGGPTRTLFTPVPQMHQRITVKPFGEYFTPESSPVHDPFIGWHTAIDVEYTDAEDDVPVFAIADGTVLRAEWAHGYGGVVVIRHIVHEKPLLALYGHLDYKALPDVGENVSAGEQIGHLGDDQSYETDGNRKHLHFGIPLSEPVDIRGYVQHESELSGWADPLTLFPEECTTPAEDLLTPGTVAC